MTDCSLLEPEAKINASSLKLLSLKYLTTATGKENKTLGSKTCVSYCDKMPEEGHLKRKDLILLTVLEHGCMVELAPFPRTNGDLEHNGGESVIGKSCWAHGKQEKQGGTRHKVTVQRHTPSHQHCPVRPSFLLPITSE